MPGRETNQQQEQIRDDTLGTQQRANEDQKQVQEHQQHGHQQQQQQQQQPPPQEQEQQVYNAPKLQIGLSDFDVLRRLGDGSFSTVMAARFRGDGQLYAVKVISKSLVLRNKMSEYIRNERNILDKLHHPGIAALRFTFQDADSLYMVLELCPHGELYQQLTARGPLPLADVVQYAAEIVDILAYLRRVEVVHRDLKPENLLLDASGHLRLIDFGSAKAFGLPPTARLSLNHRATSFVGTAEYVSPEVLTNAGVGFSADLWALGCIIFQLLAGRPPYKGASEYLTFQAITAGVVDFPPGFPAAARSLVEQLLQQEPDKRLGAKNIAELQAHPFFEGVRWHAVRDAPAPLFVPPPAPGPDDLGLDWELTSLFNSSQLPRVKYEYLPPGAQV